jgi:histone-lysine N-methyltransferase SETD1
VISSFSRLSSTSAPVKAQSTTPRRADGLDGHTPMLNGSAHEAPAAERVPARDPSRSITCIRCTYDPLLDTSLSSSEKRKAKATYKEFGLVCAKYNLTLRGERHLNYEVIG